jgi:hypothetical protein
VAGFSIYIIFGIWIEHGQIWPEVELPAAQAASLIFSPFTIEWRINKILKVCIFFFLASIYQTHLHNRRLIGDFLLKNQKN